MTRKRKDGQKEPEGSLKGLWFGCLREFQAQLSGVLNFWFFPFDPISSSAGERERLGFATGNPDAFLKNLVFELRGGRPLVSL